jgi:nucleotidyltransferase AbiEii toxin of type IV toxin-antitoxin system
LDYFVRDSALLGIDLCCAAVFYDPETRTVSDAVESTFGFAEISVVSFSDLYAGKIVAALDLQHPRDLFDVRDLLTNEGMDDALRKAFTVYLLNHDRPMSEVLAPTHKDISVEFLRGFDGMTEEAVSLDELIATRETLIGQIVGQMPDSHRRFLVPFERGGPDWALLDVLGAEEVAAVKWHLNLDKLSARKRAELVEALK